MVTLNEDSAVARADYQHLGQRYMKTMNFARSSAPGGDESIQDLLSRERVTLHMTVDKVQSSRMNKKGTIMTIDNMEGKVILITGGNAGLGRAAATALAQMGATIVILARNQERADQAITDISNITGNQDLHVLLADLASLSSVRAATAEFRKRFDRLDVLINNAAVNVSTRTETGDGFETHFGVNYLSHYLLTRLLQDLLEQSSPSRIVNVGARQMGAKLDFEDLQLKSNWTAMKAVTQAKLSMFLFTREMARRLAGKNVTVNILDPGLVKTNYHKQAGPFLGLILKLFGKDPEQAVETYVYLASSNEVENASGRFFSAGREVSIKGQALDNAIAAQLWEFSAKAVSLI